MKYVNHNREMEAQNILLQTALTEARQGSLSNQDLHDAIEECRDGLNIKNEQYTEQGRVNLELHAVNEAL